MPRATFDHLVVAAERLADGVEHVTDALGVRPMPGGRHDHMNTHNAVLRLGERAYLEVIAVDPEAGPPEAPRWFDLDGRDTRALLAAGPRLLTWVARCDDLAAVCGTVPWEAGPIRRMRRGPMTWRIAFPADGHLVRDGLVPLLIEWDAGTPHPAGKLPETGCSLAGLRGVHAEPDAIRGELAEAGLDADIELLPPEDNERPRLEAEIDTPQGRRTLA